MSGSQVTNNASTAELNFLAGKVGVNAAVLHQT